MTLVVVVGLVVVLVVEEIVVIGVVVGGEIMYSTVSGPDGMTRTGEPLT